jgi:serine/threonine protein kinase
MEPTTTSSNFPGCLGSKINNYTLGERVGRGRTSTVYALAETSSPAIIKVYRSKLDDPAGYADEWREEINYLSKFRGTCFPELIDVSAYAEFKNDQTRLHLCVIMEYAGLSVARILKKDGPLPEGTANTIAYDVCRGLALIHEAGLFHSDIKPGNIFWNGEHGKIGDLAAIVDPNNEEKGAAGTTAYWAPEYIYSNPRSPSVDMWALGVTYFEMLTRDALFDAYGDTQTIYGGDLDEFGILSIEEDSEDSSIESVDETADFLTNFRLSCLFHRILGAPPEHIRCQMRGHFDTSGCPRNNKLQESVLLAEYLCNWPDINVPKVMRVIDGLICWDPEDRQTAKEAVRLFKDIPSKPTKKPRKPKTVKKVFRGPE